MPIEHNVIPDAERHEPKAFDVALEHQALHAEDDGAGGLTSKFKYPAGTVYAEMDIINNTVAHTHVAAVDATLNTDSDYMKATGAGFPWVSTHADLVTFDTDKFVVQVAGDYQIHFWASMKIVNNNNFFGIKYAINDATPYSLQKIVSQSVTANDIRNVSGMGIVAGLAVGDSISLYMASTIGGNMTFQDGGITLTLLHEV